ncbi:hypothetical protein [Nonomuraea sp. bgisy101]|uniref:hypothetical protein n=1 Tax=Nonomuraea sp. bgisy101 TaxID=3413784 RepID=UPI003D70A7BC
MVNLIPSEWIQSYPNGWAAVEEAFSEREIAAQWCWPARTQNARTLASLGRLPPASGNQR